MTQRKICGATNRQGKPCQSPPMKGKTRCKLHGGATPTGEASPQFKHGRYSKHMPAGMREKFERALEDQQLLELTADAALLDALVVERLEALATVESGETWKALHDVWQQVEGTSDAEALKGLLREVGRLIRKGRGEYYARVELVDLTRQRAMLAREEGRRRKEAELNVPVEQIAIFLSAVSDVLRKHLPPETAQTIRDELSRLDGQHRGGSVEPEAGDDDGLSVRVVSAAAPDCGAGPAEPEGVGVPPAPGPAESVG